MEKIRKQFPALRKQIYANTPVYGPLYDDLLDWRQEHDLDFLLKASEMREKSLRTISDTRTTVGRFFGCKRENVALVHNFSLALNLLLGGLDEKEKVLLLEEDYPSVNWPFESRGFDISYVKIDADLEENIRVEVRRKNRTVLAISLVQWQNGIKMDLDFLRNLKQEFPNLLIIADGTQFCGTESFSFDTSGIDVLGASAYKWLLAGYGNGFMLLKDGVEDRVPSQIIGFNAADGDFAKKDSLRFAKRFEAGHLSCLNFGSMKFSMDFLEAVGKESIEVQNRKLSKKGKSEFEQLGLLSDAVVARKNHSTIFNIKGDGGLFQYLSQNNVVCAQRGDGIRLGFHFYNTEDDIDEIVKIIKKAKE